MKARELRIGNYLNVLGVPVAISANHIVAIENGDTSYKPIPFTVEWLEKFGFEKKYSI